MTRKKQTTGTCAYCGSKMSRSGMAKHLQSCEKRAQAIAAANAKSGANAILYHLQVQDNWGGDFWLHLEMPGKATLRDLDYYLRAIWLECCGHLSQFSLKRWGDEISMNAKAGQVFQPGLELIHIYDFGTSSETKVKVLSTRQGKPTTPHPIALMARNDMPEAFCIECGKPATRLCVQCLYEEEQSGTLCDKHTKTHPHDDYGEPMPLLNSPRVGMCGYDGPAIPPY